MNRPVSKTDRPRLSVVVTARNDDHGGNFFQRMQVFVTGFIEQCRRHELHAELVIVEWNPPDDRPRLSEALSFHRTPGPCRVRTIEVPNSLHRRLAHSDNLPLFQMIAKNAGIRRSHGDFVLATNIDILFNDELMAYLTNGSMSEDCFYRIDRCDIPSDVPPDATIEEQLAYCDDHLMRINARNGSLDLQTGHFAIVYLDQHYQMMRTQYDSMRSLLHTNACGDFTMLAKDRWFELKGYAEFAMYSFHIDSIFCFMAYHHGLRETVLVDPMRIYHIEHDAGWSPGEGDKKLKDRLKSKGIPRLSNEELNAVAIQMQQEKRAIIFNDDHWGFADADLKETVIESPMAPS